MGLKTRFLVVALLLTMVLPNTVNATLVNVSSGTVNFVDTGVDTSNQNDQLLSVSGTGSVNFNNDTIFENNSYNGFFINASGGNINFGNNSIIQNNSFQSMMDIGSNSLVKFGENTRFEGNVGDAWGSIAYVGVNGHLIFQNNTVFENNYNTQNVGFYGGGLFFQEHGLVEFNGNTSFLNNQTMGNAALFSGGTAGTAAFINFNTTEAGQKILFEGNVNAYGYNSFYFIINGSTERNQVNFNLVPGTFADIKDSIGSDAVYVDFNLNSGGSMFLYGDNTQYRGSLNVNSGNLYTMNGFYYGEDFDMSVAQHINFADNTTIRPQYIGHDATNLYLNSPILNPSTISVTGSSYLVPQGISILDVGTYDFNFAYSSYFSGWDNNLAKLDISTNQITIKSDLEGYQKLPALADITRKRNDLTEMEREMFDNIYYTGAVSDEVLDYFGILSGDDINSFEEIHRGTVRQFGRQIVSRVHNRNNPENGLKSHYSDEHLWFNMGQNWIDKDKSSTSAGYKYTPTSFAFGYDQDIIANKLNVGLGVGYGFGQSKSKTSGVKDTNDINEYLLSFYGKYKPAKPYISWNLGGGLITNETKVIGVGTNIRGNYDTTALFANVEFGYNFCVNCVTLEPYTGIEYTYLRSESHTEKGAGSRHIDAFDWYLLEVPVGVRMSADMHFKDYIFTPALDVAYARNFGDTHASTTAFFVSTPTSPWKMSSSTDERDSFRGALNMKFNSKLYPFAINFGYALDYRSDYMDNQGYATIRYDF